MFVCDQSASFHGVRQRGRPTQRLFPRSSIHQRRLEGNLSEETLCSPLEERQTEFQGLWRRSRGGYFESHPATRQSPASKTLTSSCSFCSSCCYCSSCSSAPLLLLFLLLLLLLLLLLYQLTTQLTNKLLTFILKVKISDLGSLKRLKCIRTTSDHYLNDDQ